MSKATLNDLVNLQNETSAVNTINANNAVIETAFDNTLSRNGLSPNQMQASLDMNSNHILNLPSPVSNYEPIRAIDIDTLNGGGTIVVSPLPVGGTIGQVLSKNSSTNFDVSWQNDLSANISGVVNVLSFGAVGDDATDNQTAITAAIASAASLGKPLVFPAGTYRFSGNLNFAPQGNTTTEFLGSVTLKHIGTGLAVSLGVASPTFGCQFGWNNPPLLTGNVNTTKVLYIHNLDHAKVAARIGNGNSLSGYGCHIDGAVLSDFDIECSANTTVFTSRPYFAIYINNVTDGTLDLTNEGQINVITMQTCELCRVSGTSEGNDTGGIFIDSGCTFNVFTCFDCEANNGSTAYDFQITGSDNTFINCLGSSSINVNLSVSGSRNTFRNGAYGVAQISGVRNRFDTIQFGGSFVDGGTNTRTSDCLGPSGYLATTGA